MLRTASRCCQASVTPVVGELLEESTLGPHVALAERMDRVDLAQVVGQPSDKRLPAQVTQEAP